MTRADFVTGDANREAIALVDRWPDWPPLVFLVGPAGSGKSHLVEVWRSASGASLVPAPSLSDRDLTAYVAPGAVAVEDLHAGPIDEAALFHLINLARERAAPMLLSSRTQPQALGIRLPDLASRLRAARLVTLGEPDDDLLRRVLVKLFADRQLTLESSVIDFVLVRMERSLAAANEIVDALDRLALAEGKPITRRLAAGILGTVAEPDGEDASG